MDVVVQGNGPDSVGHQVAEVFHLKVLCQGNGCHGGNLKLVVFLILCVGLTHLVCLFVCTGILGPVPAVYSGSTNNH